jgi:hypothetical protein
MRKVRSRKLEPTRASLRELPEVDLRASTVRRNPFAARIAAEGIHIVHDGPSRASLAAIPEVDLRTAKLRRNPFAKQIDASALRMHVRRGRPAADDADAGPTVTRSVRLPEALAKALEAIAKHEGVTVHALMRTTLADRVRAVLSPYAPLAAREGRPARRPNPPAASRKRRAAR